MTDPTPTCPTFEAVLDLLDGKEGEPEETEGDDETEDDREEA
jgi:hypothetical protein